MTKNALKFAKSVFPAENISAVKNLNTRYFKRLKIVVFVPEDFTDKLTFAMASAGAGVIGKYSVCSFRAGGTGTFKGGKGSNPVIGKKGKFEKTEEVRLEMVCDAKDLDGVIDKMLELHPYEEPAYDIYEVYSRDKSGENDLIEVIFNKPVPIKIILEKINRKINPEIIARMPVKGNYSRAVINFTGHRIYPGFDGIKNKKTFYISLNKNENINIRFK